MDYLQKKDNGGDSPYDRISDLLLKLFMERPPQKRVYSEFEQLVSQLQLDSAQQKCQATEREKVVATYEFKQYEKPVPFNPETEEDEDEKEEADEEDEENSEHSDGIEHEDLPQLSSILEAAGQSFSLIDAFRIETAIHDLAKREERSADRIKLFGKVGPYWLLRAETETYPETEEQNEEVDEEEVEPSNEEEISEKDDELLELRDKWEEIEEEMAAEQAQDKPEGADEDQPESVHNEGENEEKHETEEGEEENENDQDLVEKEEEVYEEEEVEEENELMKSTLSLDDELQPETKIPKKVPVYGNKPYPKTKVQKLPMEEHDGVNKDLFFAAIDSMGQYMEELYCCLQKECELQEFRKINKLKQEKSKLSKLIEKIVAEPLNFVALPEVTPEQMRIFLEMPAQLIRFTGDLTETVISSIPPFNYSESVLLRCACAKILHENTIVPKGMYIKEAEEEDTEIRPKIEDLEQLEREKVERRYEAMAKFRNRKIYEIMLALPDLWKYSEDEDRLETEAVFPELNEEFKGYESARALLNYKQWEYLLPRICGQGKAQPIAELDYDGIDDPEPCEYEVAKLEKQRRAEQERNKIEILKKEHEIEAEEKKETMKKKRYATWLEQQQEVWEAELDELEQNEESDEEVNVPVDDFDDTEQPEKFAIEADTPYEEIAKYYAVRLWRKLRVFQRPVDPWDAPILDNRPNCLLPDLFIEEGQLDRTRVDFKQKCTYHVDEGYGQNKVEIKGDGETTVSQIPIWRFQMVDMQRIGTGPKAVIACNSRCPGAINIVCGSRMQRHHFLYFGDGLSDYERVMPDFEMPEMCVPPLDITEELEIDPSYQRMEWDVIKNKIRMAEEARRAAEEEQAAEDNQEDE